MNLYSAFLFIPEEFIHGVLFALSSVGTIVCVHTFLTRSAKGQKLFLGLALLLSLFVAIYLGNKYLNEANNFSTSNYPQQLCCRMYCDGSQPTN